MLIETEHLIIRHFSPDDVEALTTILFSDPEVMHFSLSGIRSKKQTKEFIQWCIKTYEQVGFGQYALVLKENNSLIGCCGFFTETIDDQIETELSYRLGKTFWGKGLATEAAKACRDYAFIKLNIKRLISIIDPNNYPSIRVAEKLGFKLEKETTCHNIPVLIFVGPDIKQVEKLFRASQLISSCN
jgi:ribosomal-protein-alanine N-acetyltransferase